jgi:ATP-binding cassette subfamily B protein
MSNNNNLFTGEQLKTSLYNAISSCKHAFWIIFFFSCLINILVMVMPIYTMQILDRVVTSQSTKTLLLLTIIAFVATSVMIFLEGIRSMILQKIGEWLESSLSKELIQKALAFTLINPNISGSQVLRDISTIRSFIGGQIIIALFDAPWAILFFIMMMLINIKIAIIGFFGILLLILLAYLTEKTLGKKMKIVNEFQVRNYSEMESAIKNAEIVESMGMSSSVVRLWNRKNKSVNDLQDQTNFLYTILSSMMKLLKIVLNTFILAGGIYFSLSSGQHVGGILACSMLMGRVMAPIDVLIQGSKMITSARASYARLQTILINIPIRDSAMKLPTPLGYISFDRVMFAPPGSQKLTIKSISFDVSPGDCLCIIGPSGSGKSTVAKLLSGIWRASNGSVKLDGADIYTYNREDFGEIAGYVPQDIELFNTSIKSNIARLSDEVDPHKVVRAAKIAGVHELILSLPNGYDTIVGQGGVTFSGGQKQRIALARAFYGDIKILILDEPNSNLDQAGEQSLMNAIYYAKQSKITVIFTTHKTQMIGISDKLMVMNDGLISAFGKTSEVVDFLQKKSNPNYTSSYDQYKAEVYETMKNKNQQNSTAQKNDLNSQENDNRQDEIKNKENPINTSDIIQNQDNLSIKSKTSFQNGFTINPFKKNIITDQQIKNEKSENPQINENAQIISDT